MGGRVVGVRVQGTGRRVAPVVAQAQGPGGVGHAVGGVVEAPTGQREAQARHVGDVRHGLPEFGRAPTFLLQVRLADIVQRVAVVRGVWRVVAAEVDPEDGGQQVPGEIVVRWRATGASQAPRGPGPYRPGCPAWPGVRPHPGPWPVACAAVCDADLAQPHHNLVQLRQEVGVLAA